MRAIKTRPVLGGCGRAVTFAPEVSTSLTRAQHARKVRKTLDAIGMAGVVFAFIMLLLECARVIR